MSVRSDAQKLFTGTLVEFYVIDLTALGGSIYRFHPGLNELRTDVVWQGQTYTRFPIEATGFDKRSSGTLPRPTVKVANIGGVLGAEARNWHDFVGAKFTRKRTFMKYLDAVNFSGGNPYADPNQYFPEEIYYVDRKTHEDAIYISFELAAATDLAGVALPARQVIQNCCTHQYRSAECGYTGGPCARKDDTQNIVANVNLLTLAEDDCGKRLNSCKLRFGTYGVLNFGGFPGAGLIRS